MNTSSSTKVLAAALLAFASSAVFADDIGYPAVTVNAAPLTRAQVRAEVKAEDAAVRANPSLQLRDVNYPGEQSGTVATRSRAEVVAELHAAQLAHENGVVIGQ